jgi:hypothetical protein
MAEWFTRPPYLGAWAAGVVLLLLAGEAMLLHGLWGSRREADARATPLAVPAVAVPRDAAPVQPPAEQPTVTVRSLPPRPRFRAAVPAPLTNAPAVIPPAPAPASEPSITPREFPVPEDEAGRFRQPELLPGSTPVAPVVPTTPVEPAVPAAPRVETPPVLRPTPAAAPRARESGLLMLYFDADSSTFAHHHERLPLRVVVFVDGKKRLDTSDPEKREFEVARLPAGRHQVRIVPYVADYPSEPLEAGVRVQPGEATTYKAVLRKSHDISRIGKFEPRD